MYPKKTDEDRAKEFAEKYGLSKLLEACKNSYSLFDVSISANIPYNGRYSAVLKNFIKVFNVDTSHFDVKKKQRKHEKITKKCPVCSNEFRTVSSGPEERITCGYACSNTYFRSRPLKPDNEVTYDRLCWRYHKKKCVVCDESNIVAAHHFNEDHEDNRPENLVPLCPTHHQYVHSKYRHLVDDVIKKYVTDFITTKNSNNEI